MDFRLHLGGGVSGARWPLSEPSGICPGRNNVVGDTVKRLLSLLAALACVVAVITPAATAASSKKPQVTELEKVQAYVAPSIVNIQVDWSAYVWDRHNRKVFQNITGNGKLREFKATFQCTGYVVNPNGYIATAGHCVDPNQVREYFYDQAAAWAAQCGCYYGAALSADQIRSFSDDWTLKHYDKNSDSVKNNALREKVQASWSISAGGVDVGKALPARVVKYQNFDDGDGALLKVEATGLPALPLIEGQPTIGSKVVAVGFPVAVDEVTDADLEPSYKDGSLGSKSTEGGGLVSVYEISAAASGGMSGGPVVNIKGEVLGFISFKNAQETQAFNFMRPASTIKELAVPGSENQLDADAKAYRAGLDAYFKGDRAAAVKNLSKVVEDQPTNKYAHDYLDKAKKLPLPPQPKSSFPVVPLVIGLVVLLLIAGLVALLLMRKGKKPAAGAPAGMAYPPGGYPPAGPSAPPAPGAPASGSPGATPVGVGAPAGPSAQGQYPQAPGQYPQSPGQYPPPSAQAPQGPKAPAESTPSAPLGFTPPPSPPTPAPGPEQGPSAQAGPAPQAGHTFCSNCGARHDPAAKFCANCGAAQ